MYLHPVQRFAQKRGKTPDHFLFKRMMPDIQKRQGSVQGVVVFYVAGNEDIRSGLGGGLDKGSAGTGTIGDTPEWSGAVNRQAGQAGAVQADVAGKQAKQSIKGQGIGQIAHTAEAPERIRLARAGLKHADLVESQLLRQPAGRTIHHGVQ